MTVVYLDSLFLMNLGLDSLLLASAQRLGGVRGQLWRTLTAASFGAAYTAAVFCLRWAWLTHPVVKCAAAVVMVLMASGRERRPLRVMGLFFLLSCALAGGVMLMELTGTGTMSNEQGFPATVSDGQMLAVCGAGEYLAVSAVSRFGGGGLETVSVLLRCEGRTVLLRVLVDSGNLLRDPVTGEPVLIAQRQAVACLFPGKTAPTAEELNSPAQVMASAEGWTASRLRLLPYRAVGTQRGMLLALRVDEMEVNGQRWKNRLAALTAEDFDGGYQGIIGTQQGGIL